jgi:TolB-like protein
MKKTQFMRLGIFLFLVAGSITAGSRALYAQAAVSLDEAIRSSAEEIDAKLTRGNKVVVLNFNSMSQRLSNYVLDEMMTVLVKSGKVTVVDRANLELIQKEMSFQMSGEVSDSSAQAIGQKLGAQSIISGSIEDMGANYRIRFRTIEVVSAAIQVLSSFNVTKDNQIAALTGGSTSIASGVSSAQYPNGLNFSNERKVGAGFLNWIFGIGSFTMGDWVGGLIVGGLELIGNIVFITGLATEIEYETFPGYYDGYYYHEPTYGYEPDWSTAMVGMGISLVGTIIGHVRPFAYDKALAKKNGTYYSVEDGNPLYHITFSPVPTRNGMGMGVFYAVSY